MGQSLLHLQIRPDLGTDPRDVQVLATVALVRLAEVGPRRHLCQPHFLEKAFCRLMEGVVRLDHRLRTILDGGILLQKPLHRRRRPIVRGRAFLHALLGKTGERQSKSRLEILRTRGQSNKSESRATNQRTDQQQINRSGEVKQQIMVRHTFHVTCCMHCCHVFLLSWGRARDV